MKRHGKINPILIVVLLVVIVVGAGSAYYFTRDDKGKQEMLDAGAKAADQTRRAGIKTEIAATKLAIDKYEAFLKAIKEKKTSGKEPDPRMPGYDAFDYRKESEYKASLDEQQRRLSDLNARLGSAYGH